MCRTIATLPGGTQVSARQFLLRILTSNAQRYGLKCSLRRTPALESLMPLVQRAERYFEFAALGTNWKTECLAGITTFMTMAYIIFVNPSILHEAGMPVAGVTAATCLAAAIGSILMGVLARYPIALAPGMGLNAYFTYSVVKAMHVPWQTALGAVFLSGIIFLALTYSGIRQRLLAA